MTQPRIFFLHNPKAGGSSLRELLRGLMTGASVAPVFSNAPNEHRATAENINSYRGFDLYAGHYGFEVYQLLGQRHLLVTNFRDPIRRVHSLYRYWRHNVSLESLSNSHPKDAAVVRLAHDLSFAEFIRSENEDLRLYMSNFHFRQLYRSGWENLAPSTRAMFVVKRRIRNMPWFYVAETPDVSQLLLHRLFPSSAELTIPVQNESAGPSEPISRADAEHIARINRLDYAIYGFALKVQSLRVAKARC